MQLKKTRTLNLTDSIKRTEKKPSQIFTNTRIDKRTQITRGTNLK